MSKSLKIIIIAIIVIILGVMLNLFVWYSNALKPVDKNGNSGENLITVEIEEKMRTNSIAELLEEKNVIKNANVMKIYCKINKVNILQAGKYELDPTEDMPTIIEHIINGDVSSDEIKITFVEGKNIRWFADIIAQKTINTEEDVYNLLEDEDYIDSLIEKYWFLTEDIKNEDIYYPLEGYLFPNTYAFLNRDVDVKTIIETMLTEMGKKLEGYKDTIKNSGYSVHKILTLSSIVELEGASADDRAAVAGVFYNRINDGWVLGSDVTTYYYLKIDDFKQSLNGNKNLYTCDYAYNTRCTSFAGLPVGPVSNPGIESIEGTINYKKHNYYYFVADCGGKTYLNKDITGHYNTINKLKNENNWCV